MLWSLFFLFSLPIQEEHTIDEIVSVDVVLLDVLVLDDQGLPITDLQANDFEIFENKRPVSRNYFEVVDLRKPTLQPLSDDDPLMQTMVLVLDLTRADVRNTRHCFQEIRHFLQDQPATLPMQMLIFSTDYGMVTKGFTTDRIAALDDFTQFEVNFLDRREQLPAFHEQFSLMDLEREIRSCIPKTVNAPSAFRATSATEMAKNCIRQAFDRFSRNQDQRSRLTLESLERVFASLAGIEGMKSVYLVTPGLTTYPGKAGAQLATRYMQSFTTQQNANLFGRIGGSSAPGVPVGTAGTDTFDFNAILNSRAPRSNEYIVGNLEKQVLRLAHMALTTRTTIHTFTLPQNFLLDRRSHDFSRAEANNLQIDHAYTTFSDELNQGHSELSSATGGLHIREKALGKNLATTLSRTKFYYVLGYAKPKRSKKGFRQIQIKIHRDHAQVHHQRGYYRLKHR